MSLGLPQIATKTISGCQISRQTMEYEKFSEEKQRNLRRVAFFAVVVSTVAVVTAVVTIPMIYSYVQNLQSHLMAELDFCKVRVSAALSKSVRVGLHGN